MLLSTSCEFVEDGQAEPASRAELPARLPQFDAAPARDFRFGDPAPSAVEESEGLGRDVATDVPKPLDVDEEASAPGVERLVFDAVISSSPAFNRTDATTLDGSVVSGDIHVFATVEGIELARVEWFFDGVLYRDNDLLAPYDLVPASDGNSGILPDELAGDGGHTVTARLVIATDDGTAVGEATQMVEVHASFEVDDEAAASPSPPPDGGEVASEPDSTPSTTVPAPPSTSVPATGSTPCMPTSSQSVGWRGIGTPEESLTPMTGRVLLGDNAILENFDIYGYIEVAGDNVTIRNGRVTAKPGEAGWGMIEIRGSGALIEDVELDGNGGVGTNGLWVHDSAGGGYTARRMDIHGLRDDVFKVLGPVTLDRIYAHDRYALNPAAHADAVQLQNYRSDGRLTVLCSNLDWGIPSGYGPSDVSAGIISGGQGIWIADYTLPYIEFRDTRIVSVGYTLGLSVTDTVIFCGVEARSDMGWGVVHPGFGDLAAPTVKWDVVDLASGLAVDPPSGSATNC